MSIMGKPVWAVMCGAIRQDFELYSTLAMLCEYRSKGLLDGIVISTWKGEPDNLPGLRDKLKKLNIYIQEINQPDQLMDKYLHIGFAVQAFQLRVGLDFVPEDVFVLRCRTDFSEQDIKLAEDLLEGKVDLALGKFGQWHTSLNYKIAVGRLTIARIFWYTDRCFLGYKSDLYKMVSIKATMLEYGMRLCPDMSFFYNVYAGEYPIFGEMEKMARKSSVLFENNNLMTQGLRSYYEGGGGKREEFELPALLNKVFGLYFIVMYNCFYEIVQQKKDVGTLDIYDVFLGNKEGGMTREATCEAVVRDPEIIRRIIDGECKQTNGYKKLYSEICKMMGAGYAERLHITQKDYEEYALWVKKVLKLDPNKVLSWSSPAVDRMEDIRFSDALDILYSEKNYNEKRSFHGVMYDICFGKKRQYYRSIVDNYARLKKIDADLYESAVAASVRTDWPFVLKYVAKSVYLGTVSEDRIGSYRFIFDRNVDNNHFFKLPMAADILSTNYYYGKFAEEHGDSKYERKFYSFLLKEYGGQEDDITGSYADAAIDTIKKYANTHYKEIDSNVSAKNAVTFLLDEFGTEAFSDEAVNYLEEFIAERKYERPFKMGEADAYEQLLEGAKKARGKLEAKKIARLILREWPKQPARIREDALYLLRELNSRFFIVDSCLLQAAGLGEEEMLDISAAKSLSDDDYIVFLNLLLVHGCIADRYEELVKTCDGDLFRLFALEVFARIENSPEIAFFSRKDSAAGMELWVDHERYVQTEFDKTLLTVHNDEWVPWPHAENASPSKFAGFVRYEKKKQVLLYSVEFATDSYGEKAQLLSAVKESTGLSFDEGARIVRLKKKVLSAKNHDEIKKNVNAALDDLCSIGAKLVASLNAVKDSELVEAPFSEKNIDIWKKISNWLRG